ncbi:MAG: hypothetical protein ABFS56_14450 [Pseudomonadota bacterium]
MAKKVTARSTKPEIIAAYNELESAYQELKAKQENMALPLTEPVPSKANAPVAQEEAPMKEVIAALGQMGEKFNTALSQLSTNLLVEASGLKEVRTTVETESSRLASLYGLEIEVDTLSDLLKQYTESAEQYQETFKQKREDAEKAWVEKNQAWQLEKEETGQRLQEQESGDKKTQKREDTEYRYNLTLKRGISDEDDTQKVKQQQEALKELEEARHKAWEEREKALAEREKQFNEHKTKVERFPKELETAIKKAKEEGTGIARHQAKIKAELAAKEFAGEEELNQLKIRSLEGEVADQSSQIDKLSKQLEAALKQAQELAVKAIEGGSSHSSFEALKEIALEQAKNQPKAK